MTALVITAGAPITPEFMACACEAWSWALRMRITTMTVALERLSTEELRDVVLAADILRATALSLAGGSL